ncbi:transporter substrate-binding domain-containing protein [Frankia sp. Cr1]|uniref:transporter substrate-binding domain-containing protein n=1 Tax=Frankia sp. Cr1 TaxID=3073931 RepID=UPI002AD3EA79|nr:transporter substrate-binding domain-containing protein [Frankia sp. Cr1]
MSIATAVVPTLETVRSAGTLRTVVSRGIRGLSFQTAGGLWSGLDVDIARAVAAATIGDATAVTWLPTDPARRLDRLIGDDADLVTSNLSWTLGREAGGSVLFPGVIAYDGEGFLVRAADGFDTPEQLAGRRLAIQAGTTSAANLNAWYGSRGLSVQPVTYATPADALAGYVHGECAAYVLDRMALAGERAALPDADAHRILTEMISREPMAMAVRDDDPAWFRVCRWVLNFLFAAEHAAAQASTVGRAAALDAVAGTAGVNGPNLGLDEAWARRVLAAVGTYGDIYDRNLGPSSGLDIPRGMNELWTRGGLHYALPLH